MKLNKKGFTLVELLAVIVILVIIVSIAIPTITSTLERQKQKKVTSEQELLASAAEVYLTEKASEYNYRNGDNCSIRIEDLIENGYISEKNIENIKDAKNKCIILNENENEKYEIGSCSETACDNSAAKSKNALLSNLVIEGATLSPKFSANKLEYKLTESLEEGTTSVKVIAAKSDSASKVTITGNTGLNEGANQIKIIVEAEASTEEKPITKTYKVTVNVEGKKSTNNTLKSITVNNTEIIDTKNITFKYGTSSVNIVATADDPNAKVSGDIGTQTVTSGTTHKFEIIVTSEAGTEQTYNINVKIKASEDWIGCFKFDIVNKAITDYSSGCSKEVTIPRELDGYIVDKIGKSAFNNKGLTYVALSTSESPTQVTEIGDSAFSNNILKDIIIPSSVTKIGNEAFAYNYIKEVIIPSSVTEIGSYAFAINDLENVVLNGTPTINDSSFAIAGELSNKELSTVYNYGETKIKFNPRIFGYIGGSENIEEGIMNLESSEEKSLLIVTENCFKYNMVNESDIDGVVDNDDRILKVGVSSLKDDYKDYIKYLYVPSKMTNVDLLIRDPKDEYNYELAPGGADVVQICEKAFESHNLIKVVIPDVVQKIEGSVFLDNNITTLDLGSVVNIGNFAFANNDIKNITIPNNVTWIGDKAFYNNYNLQSFSFARNVENTSYLDYCDAILGVDGTDKRLTTVSGFNISGVDSRWSQKLRYKYKDDTIGWKNFVHKALNIDPIPDNGFPVGKLYPDYWTFENSCSTWVGANNGTDGYGEYGFACDQ